MLTWMRCLVTCVRWSRVFISGQTMTLLPPHRTHYPCFLAIQTWANQRWPLQHRRQWRQNQNHLQLPVACRHLRRHLHRWKVAVWEIRTYLHHLHQEILWMGVANRCHLLHLLTTWRHLHHLIQNHHHQERHHYLP